MRLFSQSDLDITDDTTIGQAIAILQAQEILVMARLAAIRREIAATEAKIRALNNRPPASVVSPSPQVRGASEQHPARTIVYRQGQSA